MADYHQIIRELKSRKDVEMNLNRMTALSKDAAYRFALISFAFYDMTFFEGLDHRNGENPYSDLIERLVSLKRRHLNGESVSFQEVAAVREENRRRMEELTKAVDLFSMLEYVLNRIEHRFVGASELPAGYSDLSETERILNYIGSQRQDIQNVSLYRMVEQLPVRMTRNRFYETVKDRLSVYKGSDTAAFDGIVSSVRSASGAFLSEKDVDNYADLTVLYREIADTALDAVDRILFETWSDRLRNIGNRINQDMDCSQALQNVLNTFGAVLLSQYEGLVLPAEKAQTDVILHTVLNAYGQGSPDLSAAYEACRELEGTLEDAGEKYHEIFSAMEELENRFVFDDADVKRIAVLLSNSAFAETDRSSFLTGYEVDDRVFEEKTEALIRDLAAHFTGLPRHLLRASMARVFSILPPRFTDAESLETYVSEALSGCHDTAEKLGVLELLDAIMSEP